jgi:hypothetical protein
MEAEDYLDRVKANWQAATSRAVSDGVHIAARAPVGYLRMDQYDPQHDARGKLIRDGRLVVDDEAAPVIREAFELRAGRASYGRVLEHVKAGLGRGVAQSTLTGIFTNRAYLGEARGPGGAVKKDAHPALVSPELFAAVAPARKIRHPRTGSVASQARMGGLITCASCGHKLRVLGGTNARTGDREASYVCHAKYAGGDCAEPAAARVKLVDGHVIDLLTDAWEDVTAGAASAEQRYLEAQAAVKSAEEALDAWVDDPTIGTSLGPERFQRGLLARQKALDDARRVMWDMDDPGLPADAPVVYVDGKPFVYTQWGDDPAADRRHLRKHIASVTLAKADPKRRRWQPIAERVQVRWIGQE